jgi:hypothetical protein
MMPTHRAVRWSLVFVCTSALSMLSPPRGPGQEAQPAALEGAWRVVESKNGDAQDYQKPPEGAQMIKFVAGGRFIWTACQGGKIVAGATGTYKIDKDKYSETIESVLGEGQEALAGKTFEFTWKLDGKTWLHVGTIRINDQDYKIDEKWERCGK